MSLQYVCVSVCACVHVCVCVCMSTIISYRCMQYSSGTQQKAVKEYIPIKQTEGYVYI